MGIITAYGYALTGGAGDERVKEMIKKRREICNSCHNKTTMGTCAIWCVCPLYARQCDPDSECPHTPSKWSKEKFN
jgi:hypothetical protein